MGSDRTDCFVRLFGGAGAKTMGLGSARLIDTASATTPNTSVSPSDPRYFDAMPPRSAPMNMPGVQPRSISRSIAPFRLWARAEEMDVGTMVASDVPTTSSIVVRPMREAMVNPAITRAVPPVATLKCPYARRLRNMPATDLSAVGFTAAALRRKTKVLLSLQGDVFSIRYI